MSMLSAQRDELRWLADNLEEHDSHMDEYVQALRSAADTIWELRNKLCDMVDARERARVLESENAMLREAVATAIEVQAVLCGDADSLYCRNKCPLHRQESNDCLACDVIDIAQELGVEVTP